jgi:hypothetical protein
LPQVELTEEVIKEAIPEEIRNANEFLSILA